MPAALRSSVFALDRCIAGVLGAALAPLVGILAERCFGYDNTRHGRLPPPTSAAGISAAHTHAEVIAAQNVNNARALERGLLLVLVIPMGVKFLVRPRAPLYNLPHHSNGRRLPGAACAPLRLHAPVPARPCAT